MKVTEDELRKTVDKLVRMGAIKEVRVEHNEQTDFRACLMDEERLDLLAGESGADIAKRIDNLQAERLDRLNDVTLVDLRMGQLVKFLYVSYKFEYPRRRRGSNAPSQSQYLEQHAGKSANWLRKCYKAYLIVTSKAWDETYAPRWDGKGGIAGIIKTTKVPSAPRPRRPRRNSARQQELMQAVWEKDWKQAEKLINKWTNPETAGC